MSIDVSGVSKTFGTFKALNDVTLSIQQGELMALLGPSGSGKTTLLRVIAGLEPADAGSIQINGTDTTDWAVQKRNIGFVFQHYALFRHMTVFENVAFGLRVRSRATRPSKQDITARVTELLRMVQLEGFAPRFPSQLSGGQRQRVALARALAVEPQVLLLDEPFGALDAQVRQELRDWLRRLHDDLKITTIFVTHDQEEAMEVADRVVVMNKGQIEQVGTPDEVYSHPVNPFVYRFLGTVNLFHGRNGSASEPIGFARPHDVIVSRHRNGVAAMSAVVERVQPVGRVVRLSLLSESSTDPIAAELSREDYEREQFKAGETVYVRAENVQTYTEDYAI